MKKLVIAAITLALGLGTTLFSAAQAEIKLGVTAPRGALATMKSWGALGEYLQTAVGTPVKVVPVKPNETKAMVKNGEVDYMLTNPALTVVLQKKDGATPFATLNRKSGSRFGGTIISKKGSGITKAADLKGKKVMGFQFKRSAAAYIFQVKHMLDNGIDPHKDFAVFHEAKKQDDIVLAVKSGLFDAGFVKSGLLEAMAKEGKIKLDDFDIVDKKNDSLKQLHSTILYPEWCISAGAKVDPGMTSKVKAALLKLDANSKASKSANIIGFVDLISLSDLDVTLKTLHLPPYDN